MENLVGYAKRDLIIPQAPFTSMTAANAAASAWCTEVNGVPHSEICAVPAVRLDAERDLLTALPSLRPAIGRAAALLVALRGVDLGERDGRDGWNWALRRRRGDVAEALGRVREVQPALHEAGEEVTRAPEEAAHPARRIGIAVLADDDLVDELGSREDAGSAHAGRLRARDERLAIERLEVRPEFIILARGA